MSGGSSSSSVGAEAVGGELSPAQRVKNLLFKVWQPENFEEKVLEAWLIILELSKFDNIF